MPKITVYSKAWCPYCKMAKRLLTTKGVEFAEIDIDMEPERRGEMIQRSGRYTVPQIFFDDTAVGGYTDLAQMEAIGILDRLLGIKSS